MATESNPARYVEEDGDVHDRMLTTSDGLAVSRPELHKKLFFCIKTLRVVMKDMGYMSLDESTRAMIVEARTPIGGWDAGMARIKKMLASDTIDD